MKPARFDNIVSKCFVPSLVMVGQDRSEGVTRADTDSCVASYQETC